MEEDLNRALDRHARKPADDLRRRRRSAAGAEWPGTGLCPGAQADGVPCPDPSCSCDTCRQADAASLK